MLKSRNGLVIGTTALGTGITSVTFHTASRFYYGFCVIMLTTVTDAGAGQRCCVQDQVIVCDIRVNNTAEICLIKTFPS